MKRLSAWRILPLLLLRLLGLLLRVPLELLRDRAILVLRRMILVRCWCWGVDAGRRERFGWVGVTVCGRRRRR